MLIDLRELVPRYSMHITGVLHLGAHLGEEGDVYNQVGIPEVVWVEGNPDLIGPLEQAVSRYPSQKVIQALVSDKVEDAVFHITRDPEGTAMSSSILELERHLEIAPWVQEVGQQQQQTTTVDLLASEVDMSRLNFMNLDLQGAELLALKGSEQFIQHVDYIYTEVNITHLYKDCVLLPELDQWLGEHDFARWEIHMACADWGDAFYIRRGMFL